MIYACAFLTRIGERFFVKKENCALAIRDDLRDIVHTDAFRNQMKDVIEYRVMDYYQRRYREDSLE